MSRPMYRLSLIALVLAACGGDDTSIDASADADSDATPHAPTITIVAPADDTTLAVGDTLELIATATLPGTDPTQLTVTWTSDLSTAPIAVVTPSSTGRATASVTLPAGVHTLTATATSPTSAPAAASVRVTVEAPPATPTVTITPTNPTTLDDLQAEVSPIGAGHTVTYRWLVDTTDADIRTARVPAARTARDQTWRVVVHVTAPSGLTATAQAEVVIANTAPTCTAALVLPNAADTRATFTCSCNGRIDPDGDTARDTCEFFDGETPITRPNDDCTLSPDLTARGMALTCRLTPRDDTLSGPAATSLPAHVLNAPPIPPTVVLIAVDPDMTNAAGELRCETPSLAIDPDGDQLTYDVAWTVNGQPATPSTFTVVAGALTFTRDGAPATARRGDAIRCVVRAFDGAAHSPPATSAPLTLDNAPPDLGIVQIQATPSPANAASTLTCVAANATDADHDPLTFTTRWLVDGAEVATSTTLTAPHLHKGAVVRCELTATDGLATTEPVASKTAIPIENTPPTLTAIALTPENGARHDVFTCTPSGFSDLDGDPPTYRYAWKAVYDDHTVTLDHTAATFVPATLPPGATLSCLVTPNDGEVDGPTLESAPATILNTAPTLAAATITPAAPTVASTLTCEPSGFHDPDGDSPTYTITWTRNAQTLAATGPTLAGAFVKGDQIRCRVVPSDGFAEGPAVLSAAVTIGNSAPTLASVTLTPTHGSLCATYTCTPGATADADTDPVTVTYRWEKNDAVTTHTAATWTAPLAPGDTLRCAATPTDGTTAGAEHTSAFATADNAPPTLSAAAITPPNPGVGHTLTCVPNGYDDDCSPPSYTYRWLVNGAPVATTATFDTTSLALGTSVRCEATPRDALTSGAPVMSPVVTLGPGDATAPTITVVIEDGTATCATVTPERWFSNPTYTYHWSVNGGPEVVGQITRPTAACELTRCRLVVTDTRTSLSSEPATAQAPLGDGCDDGNDCTAHACNPAGGCAAPILTSGNACRHADACRPIGVCTAGDCVAEGNVCVEETLSVAGPSDAPYVTGLARGGYAAQWMSGTATVLRFTDVEDSRRNEELHLPADRTHYVGGRASPPIALPDGGLLALSLGGRDVFWDSGYGGTQSAWIDATLHHFDADGRLVSTTPVARFSQSCTPSCGLRCSGGSYVCLSCSATIADYSGFPLMLEGLPAVVATHTRRASWGNLCGPESSPVLPQPIVLVPATGEHAHTEFTLVPADQLHAQRLMVAASLPAGGDTFAVAWVGPTPDRLQVGRFTFRSGVLTAAPTHVITSGPHTISTPTISAFDDGGFVVAWTSTSTSSGLDTYFQRFDTDGYAQGEPTRINDIGAGDQILGGLTTFEDFGFAATFADGANHRMRLFSSSGTPQGASRGVNTRDAAGHARLARVQDDELVAAWNVAGEVRTRRFERDGEPAPGVREIGVAETTTGDQSRTRAALGPDHKLLVVWDGPLFVGQDTEILARIVDADGMARSTELLVNTTTAETQRGAAVAGSTDRWVVVWESLNEDGSSFGIYARLLGRDGTPLGDPFRVNTTTTGAQQRPAVAMRPDGRFVVAWDSGATPVVFARVFDKDGAPLSTELQLSTGTRAERPAITVEAVSGVFFAAWQSRDQVGAGSGFDIFGRKLDTQNAQNPLGAEVRLNATTELDQTRPALTVNGANTLAACWETVDTQASTDVVCGTFRWTNLAVVTPEFPLTPFVAGAQLDVQLTATATHELVAAWTSEGLDLSGRAVVFRSLGLTGPAAGPRTMGNRFVTGLQTRPFVVGLPYDRVLLGWQSEGQDGSGLGVYLRALTLP